MSDVEQIEHDARTCELCCPHGVTPEEAEAERVHAAILRMQEEDKIYWPDREQPPL